MRFVKDGRTWTLTDIRRAHPGISFPPVFDPSDLGYLPLTETEQPSGDVVEEAAPALINGEWTQQWSSRDFTAEELAQRTPQTVMMDQARLALLDADLLDDVEAAMANQPAAVRIQWEYSTTVGRQSPITLAMGQLLGLTAEQMDALFRKAETL